MVVVLKRFAGRVVMIVAYAICTLHPGDFRLSAADPMKKGAGPLAAADGGSPELGYRLLTRKAYLPADFDQEAFENVWNVWPEPLRSRAEDADPAERLRLAYSRYGLSERVDWATGKPDGTYQPLQYVVDEEGNWSMNCFACHGGQVGNQTFPGAPNNRFAFELLIREVRASKMQMGKPLSKMDLGSMLMPLGRTRGLTNAVMFGVGLMHYRDEELNIQRGKLPPKFTHHDMDAPAWWHFRKRPFLYIDGFAEKGHRGLMQFMLVEENDAAKLKAWADDFRHVYAYLESLQPPTYPHSIDLQLAGQGSKLFVDHCADCHGTYAVEGLGGEEWYPNRRVPLQEIGTDPVRLRALSVKGRELYARSWFTGYGKLKTDVDPHGYVAPPLDGVWASPPYFHNGSVPTLWQVLNTDERPAVWRHTRIVDIPNSDSDAGYDWDQVGLAVEEYESMPLGEDASSNRHEYFDSSEFGKSRLGHTFPEVLTQEEKRAVLEYLKML